MGISKIKILIALFLFAAVTNAQDAQQGMGWKSKGFNPFVGLTPQQLNEYSDQTDVNRPQQRTTLDAVNTLEVRFHELREIKPDRSKFGNDFGVRIVLKMSYPGSKAIGGKDYEIGNISILEDAISDHHEFNFDVKQTFDLTEAKSAMEDYIQEIKEKIAEIQSQDQQFPDFDAKNLNLFLSYHLIETDVLFDDMPKIDGRCENRHRIKLTGAEVNSPILVCARFGRPGGAEGSSSSTELFGKMKLFYQFSQLGNDLSQN